MFGCYDQWTLPVQLTTRFMTALGSCGRAGAALIRRTTICLFVLLAPCSPAEAQDAPRRQFVSVSYSWFHTQPLQFAAHPLADLLAKDVGAARGREFDYETRDGLTRVAVDEFGRGGHGAALTVYPFGLSTGATLGLRGSYETLPVIRLTESASSRTH